MVRLSLSILTLLLVATACSDQTTATSTTTTTTDRASTVAPDAETTTSVTTTSEPALSVFEVPDGLEDFTIESVVLDGVELQVALADTSELRRQGLMQVEDLLDLDGMLFVFDQDSSSGFWMKDTLISLDIAFFDAAGGFVDGFTMEPCTTDDCPTYRPSGSYRLALEMAAGMMPDDVSELRFDQ